MRSGLQTMTTARALAVCLLLSAATIANTSK
jgi:hypothetical protein